MLGTAIMLLGVLEAGDNSEHSADDGQAKDAVVGEEGSNTHLVSVEDQKGSFLVSHLFLEWSVIHLLTAGIVWHRD